MPQNILGRRNNSEYRELLQPIWKSLRIHPIPIITRGIILHYLTTVYENHGGIVLNAWGYPRLVWLKVLWPSQTS